MPPQLRLNTSIPGWNIGRWFHIISIPDKGFHSRDVFFGIDPIDIDL